MLAVDRTEPIAGTPNSVARALVDHLYAQNLVPIPGVDIGTAYLLAARDERVGGDLIDAYQFNNGSIAISVADISGKGVKAAARAAMVKYGLRAYVSSGLTPAQVLRNLNQLYIETTTFNTDDDPNSFVTVFLGIIDPEHRVMMYASAGHDPVILLSPDHAPVSLPPTAPIVGILEEAKLFHQRFVYLEPGGSAVIATTDGVTEARSPDGRFAKREDLMALIGANRLLPAQEQADALLQATSDFCSGQPQDDAAIIVACFR